MKIISVLKIDIQDLINRDIFNSDLKIKFLNVKEISFYFDERTYDYYRIQWIGNDDMINDSNVNDFKNFIDRTNIKNYKNISFFDKYYDFIINNYIFFLNEKKGISLDSLDHYLFKTSKHCLKFIKDNPKKWEKFSQQKKEEIEDVIFQFPTYAVNYANKVFNDHLPRYEEKLLKLEINDFEVTFYLYNVIRKIIYNEYGEDKKRKKLTLIYNESELFRKALEYYVNNNDYKFFFGFYFWFEEAEDIALKNPDTLKRYLFNTYFSADRSTREMFNKNIEQFIQKINKTSIGVFSYYQFDRKKLESDKNLRLILMEDPELLMKFIYENYNSKVRNNLSFEEIESLFPGYQKIISSVDKLDLIKNFINLLPEKIFKDGKHPYKYNSSEENRDLYLKLKKYIYDNYPEFIEKISKDPEKSLYFAVLTNTPFKEGEPSIYKDINIKNDYLKLIKDLGPKSVPDYDRYDIPETVEQDYEDDYEEEQEYEQDYY